MTAPSGPPAIEKNDELKKFLDGVANSGQIGSGIGVLQASVEKMKASNATVAEQLGEEIKRISEADAKNDVEAVKTIAKEMIDKLK